MTAPANMTDEHIQHLLGRTGFTPTASEIAAWRGRNADQAVAQLLHQAKQAKPKIGEPAFLKTTPVPNFASATSAKDRQDMRVEQLRQGNDFKQWWMAEMLTTTTPLQERMTLFWHNHFATSMVKVARSRIMWRQHQLLRSHGLGNFRTMLTDIISDPAMLIYLDNTNNRKEAPNENLARELFELFTLGEASEGGGYTERDIKEAARALTGWSVEAATGEFKYRPAMHDEGSKTILGRTGAWGTEQLLAIILDQPQVARYLVTKLWREFVSPEPDKAEVERIAGQFRTSGYDISVALRSLLLSDFFWMPSNRASLIKSPIEFLVGTMRLFQFDVPTPDALVIKAAQLGQHLLFPPNVKGWPGGPQWINATTLLERKRTTEQFLRSLSTAGVADNPSMAAPNAMAGNATTRANLTEIKGIKAQAARRMIEGLTQVSWDAQRWLTAQGAHMDREPDAPTRARLNALVLPLAPTQTIAQGTVSFAYVRSLTLDPVYQLK